MEEFKVEEVRYLISEASKKVNVEAHVLRYWEDELNLPIKRNELGHRYYTKEDIDRFREIKQLKERGLQLRAIKNVLGNEKKENALVTDVATKEEKAMRLQMLLKHIIREAVRESNSDMAEEIKESIVKELDYQFRILGEDEEKRSEEHFRKMDELIRGTIKRKEKKVFPARRKKGDKKRFPEHSVSEF